MSDGPVSGWYEDPHGRHALRFFDGTAWTEHVMTDGVVGADAPGGAVVAGGAGGSTERLQRGPGGLRPRAGQSRVLVGLAAGAVVAAAFGSGAVLAGDGRLEPLTGEVYSAHEVDQLGDAALERGRGAARAELEALRAELEEATTAWGQEHDGGDEGGYGTGYDDGYSDGYADALGGGAWEEAEDPDLPGTPLAACGASASPLPLAVATADDLAGRATVLYCITVPAAGRYDLSASSEELDLTMTLIGGTGPIGYSDDAHDFDPALESRHLEPGTYELRIEPFDETTTDGSFTITWAPAGA